MDKKLTIEEVAVAILNYNGISWLQKFLPSVVMYSPGANIYVIDNASTDASIAFVQANFPSVKIILNQENLGFAAGYNEGLKKIEQEIICLLNSDVEVPENWILPIISLFNSNQKTAAIQPKILSYKAPEYFEYAGGAGGFLDFLGYPTCRGRLRGDKMEKDLGQYNVQEKIFWAGGCCFFIRKSSFWEVGGFDETFFAHQEEIDLCWRLKNAGYEIWYTPESCIYHVGGGTLNSSSPKKTYLNFRNNLLMLLKNLPSYLIFPVIFSRLVLDGLAAVWLGFSQGKNHFLAVIRAHFAFYRMAGKAYQKRTGKVIGKYWDKFSIFF